LRFIFSAVSSFAMLILSLRKAQMWPNGVQSPQEIVMPTSPGTPPGKSMI